MLTQLTIQNFALIDNISIEFSKNLNVFTGETGAGKSILIDALRIVLGDRISSSQLRDSAKPCIIEAVFNLSTKFLENLSLLDDFLSEDDSVIINRSYHPDGRSKIKINGFNVTVSQLKTIGNHLIDFHGPHDHQMLLASSSHIEILDRLADFGDLFKEYRTMFSSYSELKDKLKAIRELGLSRERDLDLLSHQLKELSQVELNEDKYEELLGFRTKLNNSEKLNDCVFKLINFFEGGQVSSSEIVRSSFAPMRELNQIDENTNYLMENLSQLQEAQDQIILDLKSYVESISFDSNEAQEVNSKYDLYDDIKRKYGPTLACAEEFYRKAKDKYDLILNIEQNDSDLNEQIKEIEIKLKKIASKITSTRQKTADFLKKTIEKELSELGIVHVQFEAKISKSALELNGADDIEFYISPNAGEDLKPLSEIVSSGEAARVMLALKKALIKVDPIPILIFDEIDAQIGGRLGTIIGKKLKEISSYRQVVLITHLPQIASFAETHFKVEKQVENKKTLIAVQELDKDSRVNELAKMMSGEEKSKISVSHAKDMLSKANT